jgi:hypothetical protein
MAMYAAYSHGDRIIGTFADVGRTRIWTTLAPISSSVNHPAHESSLNMKIETRGIGPSDVQNSGNALYQRVIMFYR